MNIFTFQFKTLYLFILAVLPLSSFAQFTGDEDTNFAQFGSYQHNGNLDEHLMDVATITSSNTTLLVGYNEGANDNALLIAVWQNGLLANTFANGGVLEFDPQIGGDDRFNTVEINQADRIVLGGYSETASRDGLVARVLSDGTMDLGFNSTGFVIIDGPFGGDDEIFDIELMSDGKIVAVGYTETSANEFDTWALRLNSNGSIDSTFGTDGFVILDLGNTNDRAIVAKEMPNGDLAIGSTSSLSSIVAMLDTDGELNTAFSVDGKTTVNLNDQTIITAMQPMSNGNLLVSGTTLNATDGYEGFAQMITDNGNVSLSFANGGFESDVDPTTNNVDTSFLCYDMMELSNGQILLSGNMFEAQSDVSLMLLNADGSVDTNFGTNGVRNYDLGGSENEINGQLGMLGDGSIMLGTTTNDGADVDFLVYKLSPLMVGVEETPFAQNVNMYPNPVNEQLTLELDLPSASNVQITLMDVSGKSTGQTMNIDLQQGVQTIDLSTQVQGLSTGMYFIQCTSENASMTLNFLKL